MVNTLILLISLNTFAVNDLIQFSQKKKSTSVKSSVESGLQSGRFQVKENTGAEINTEIDDYMMTPESARQKISTKRAKKNLIRHADSSSKRPASDGSYLLEKNIKNLELKKDINQENQSNVSSEGEAEYVFDNSPPSISDQIKDLFHGGKNRVGNIYKEQIHPDDIRMNQLEINVNSGLIYDSSISNYSYRKYFSLATQVGLGAQIWVSPSVGISGYYASTFGEDITSISTSSNKISVKSEYSKLSFDFRKFFGLSRRANSIGFGFFYDENKLNVPEDASGRLKLKTAGPGLYLYGRIPVAPSYAWILGGDISPSLTHTETATLLTATSGSSVNTSRFGMYFGGEFKLSRQHQISWTLGGRMERNLFSGVSSQVDPETSQTVQGVSVTNTWSYFHLGYRWGQ